MFPVEVNVCSAKHVWFSLCCEVVVESCFDEVFFDMVDGLDIFDLGNVDFVGAKAYSRAYARLMPCNTFKILVTYHIFDVDNGCSEASGL